MSEEPVGEIQTTETPKAGQFREFGVSGLDWTMGMVKADPKIELNGVRGAEQYDMMRREDPTVAAVLLALSLPLRQASWRVNPASVAPADVEAAEFIESCLYDMSTSWDDVLTEVGTMFPFGWSWMEWVLKKRQGQQKKSGESSQYQDGRVGFRKIVLRGQTSLYEWEFDDSGGVQAMIQTDPAMGPNRRIPIEKSLLFRTTKERNNPEGFSVLRPGYRSYKYKTNMERIEAIGLQRALTGVPRVKFTGGYTTEQQAGTQSDERRANDLIKGLYQNTILGVITDDRMEFDFAVPDMQGITGDSTKVIQRYDESIARSTLAMYILLGSRERGSYALSRELGDLFFLAVDGFINSVAEVFTRWAVPVLMRYNYFPGITQYPIVTTAINRRVDLTALAEFVNKTVGAQVITPDEELESYIRELADFPPRAVILGEDDEEITPEPEGDEDVVTPQAGEPEGTSGKTAKGTLNKTPRPPAPPETDSGKHGALPGVEMFAVRQRDPLTAYRNATDDYEVALTSAYNDWIEQVEDEFAAMSEESRPVDVREKWDELLILLLLLLRRKGWEYLPAAIALGYGEPGIPPALRAQIDAELADNDAFLGESLTPAIRGVLTQEQLQQIMILYWAGQADRAGQMLREALASRRAHVGLYAGMFWRAIWIGALFAADEAGNEGPVRWVVDPVARHCTTCLLFGDREYASREALLAATGNILPGVGTECDGNCRCHLEQKIDGKWRVL